MYFSVGSDPWTYQPPATIASLRRAVRLFTEAKAISDRDKEINDTASDFLLDGAGSLPAPE